MLNSKTFDDIAARIGKAIENSPAKDIEKNVTLARECDQALDRARDQLNSGDAEARMVFREPSKHVMSSFLL